MIGGGGKVFTCTRQEAIEAIEKLADRSCCYAGSPWVSRHCDCKYGGPVEHSYSEKTGCPELRSTHLMLTHLTDDEWEEALSRSGKAVSLRHMFGGE